jgi:hypothetical protein
MPTTGPAADPLEQLRLVHDELNRQREYVANRHKSMQDRATVLIGAAGVSLGIQVANLPHWILWVVLLPSIASATLGAISIRGTRSPEIDVALLRANVLGIDIYSAEYALVTDKIQAHDFEVVALESRRRLVIAGFGFLAASWIETIVVLALNG